ncbi:PKD domain-containing protein [Kitasatospora sp. NBC_01539]|uniref:PKD domain-containing protein n=1 Tax=Kitasatospora sp. NBC_01539 TaxID=2903577 RepID=UPI00386028A8
MHRHRVVGLTVAGLTGVLGLAAPAWAETPTTLYVNNGVGTSCSDTGPGTQAVPFCSIAAAAAVAEPGQTVEIISSSYPYVGQVVVTRSGEPGRPITFHTQYMSTPIQAAAATGGPAFVLSGVHDVVLTNLTAVNGVSITGSDRITLDRMFAVGKTTRPGVEVSGSSHDVAVTRSFVRAERPTPAVRITGASRTLVGRVQGGNLGEGPLVAMTDAPGTTVVNSNGTASCGSAVTVAGDSAGVTLANNVFTDTTSTACTAASRGPLVSVAASAAAGTHTRYNLLRSDTGSPLYSWAGSEYTTLAAFGDATGEGTADRVAPAGPFPTGANSLTVDSADASVPGIPDTDRSGGAPADDPRVANTGTGHGYLDRGALEAQETFSAVAVTVDRTWAPYGTTVTATATPETTWPGAPKTYVFDFGDGAVVTTTEPTATHVYARVCSCTVQVKATNGAQVSRSSGSVRVEATEPGELRADVFVSRPMMWASEEMPTLSVEANAMNSVTPWLLADITYDFGDGSPAQSSESTWQPVRHAYTTPGDHTVTVTLRDVTGAVSTSSRTYRAAYTPTRYTAVSPFRMLDTRISGNALNGGSTMTLDVSKGYPQPDGGKTSLSPDAVVLNVTATKATGDTFIELWPTGRPRPTASHLNVKAGRTVANLVTVPVGRDGTVQLYNHGGRTDVIVDFVGVYESFGPGKLFTPTAPTRISDAGLAGNATRTLKVTGKAGIPADATAVVVNLTAASPTAAGFLIAYPHGTARPGVSNLNFGPGDVVANQAIVPVGADGSIDVYNFAGTTRIVVDVFGYYSPGSKGWFTPAGPVRLADTRADGTRSPVAGGTSLSVPVAGTNGVPADATAAVLNVTATAPTASGFLTVWPHGTPRPGTSNLNFVPGLTVPNHVITRLGEGGRVDVQNFAGSTHVLADLAGWFTDHN